MSELHGERDPRGTHRPPSSPADLPARQFWVMRGVADGRVTRERFYGSLAPWTLQDHDVSWPVTLLALRGMIQLDIWGTCPPQPTRRGFWMLNGRD
jgi:hypothetical protein